MSTPEPLTYEKILAIVRHWPVEAQLVLVQELLQTLQGDLRSVETATRLPTLAHALGLAATSQPAPDDATVERWLAERRQDKYG